MKRRQFLALCSVAIPVGTAGCAADDSDDGTPAEAENETDDSDSEGSTDDGEPSATTDQDSEGDGDEEEPDPQPELHLSIEAPEEVDTGESFEWSYTVENIGEAPVNGTLDGSVISDGETTEEGELPIDVAPGDTVTETISATEQDAPQNVQIVLVAPDDSRAEASITVVGRPALHAYSPEDLPGEVAVNESFDWTLHVENWANQLNRDEFGRGSGTVTIEYRQDGDILDTRTLEVTDLPPGESVTFEPEENGFSSAGTLHIDIFVPRHDEPYLTETIEIVSTEG